MKAYSNGMARLFAGLAASIFLAITTLSCNRTNSNPVEGGGNLSDPSLIPIVVFTLPANAATGPFKIYNPGDGAQRPSFVVQFNKLMSSYSFTPSTVTCRGFDRPVRVYLHPSNYYYMNKGLGKSTYYDDVLEFDIRDSLNYGQMRYAVGKTYTITIDTTLEDINGNHLQAPHTFFFTPEPNFRLISTIPPDGQTGAGTQNPAITAYFNSPVSQSQLSSVVFTPSIGGTWAMLTYDSLVANYSSNRQLSYNSTYDMKFPSTMVDKYSHSLGHDYQVSFKTIPFQVSYSYPASGASNVDPNSWLYVYLTGPVDPTTVASAFTITPSVQGNLASNGTTITFSALNGFNFGTTYTVTIGPSLKATDGTSIKSPYTTTFTTSQFMVTSTSPSNGTTNWISSDLSVYFNSLIDTGSVRSAFSITPSVLGQFNPYGYGNSSSFTFYPSPGLKPGTTYTVTISTAMKALTGTHLLSPYTYSFSTAQFQVWNFYPSGSSAGVSRSSLVQISMSAPVDTSTVRSAFSISPATSGYLDYYVGSTAFTFHPYNQLLPNTTYTVTISKALKAFDGSSLANSFTWAFVTGAQ